MTDNFPDWQPIDTVPNRAVLVSDGRIVWIAHHPLMSRAKPKGPTHWMPLPDDPG